MATLSLCFPGTGLRDEAVVRFRRERTREQPSVLPSRRLPDPAPVLVRGAARHIEVKIASEPDEWEQAFQLVSANYREAGYEGRTVKPYRFTDYHALPDTTVFVAKIEGRVVATFSLVADNVLLGLPLESLYADEVDELRRQGRRLAEVTSLAVSDLSQREFIQVFTTMIRVMKQFHVSRGGDTWVITVNPRHRNFYCKVLGYQPLGPCKTYAAVGDAPAEAYWLDQELMREHAPRGYEQIFGQPLPPEALIAPPLPRPFIRYFATESSQTEEAKLSGILCRLSTVGTTRAW